MTEIKKSCILWAQLFFSFWDIKVLLRGRTFRMHFLKCIPEWLAMDSFGFEAGWRNSFLCRLGHGTFIAIYSTDFSMYSLLDTRIKADTPEKLAMRVVLYNQFLQTDWLI